MTATRVEDRQLTLDGGVVFYQWVRSRRRRHWHLVLDDRAGLQVRTPWQADERDVEQLVRAQAGWIAKTLAAREARLSERPPLGEGVRLPFLAEQLELRLGVGHRLRVSRRGDQLHVSGPSHEETVVRRALEKWYRAAAADALGARVAHLSASTGLRPSGITIRSQRRRWGSCSSAGHLNLNWRLMLVGEDLADYVLVHELCHLRHMHHGPEFWALVGRHMPDYRRRRAAMNSLRGGELVL